MKESGKIMARIGMVNYLNMAPLYEKWKSTVQSENWQLVEDHPAALNKNWPTGKLIWALSPVLNMDSCRTI